MALDLFGGKYLLEQEIANGGCGTVYLGSHHIAGKPVAIKLEPAQIVPKPRPSSRMLKKAASNPNLRLNRHDQQRPPLPQSPHLPGTPHNEQHDHRDDHDRRYNGPSPLIVESQIYKKLMGGPGVPWIMYSGKQGDYNVMVIDLLGPSLEDLFKMCNRRWDLKTVLMVADQVISRLEYIHSHSFLHRDIKPSNFVIGTGSPKALATINIIDFGLAKKYKAHVKDSRTGEMIEEHIPYKQDDSHGVGTSLFASINTHLGIESSRRDDIESLAYMLVYFMRGTLPWRKVKAPLDPPPGHPIHVPYDPVALTWNMILEEKLAWEQTLCEGLPEEFDHLYRYARSLSFTDMPDYDGLRRIFRNLAEAYVWDLADGVWEWSSHPKFREIHGSSMERLPEGREPARDTPRKRERERTKSPKKGGATPLKENTPVKDGGRKRSQSRTPKKDKGKGKLKDSPQLGRLKAGMMSSPDLSTPVKDMVVPDSPVRPPPAPVHGHGAGANGTRWCEACRGRGRSRTGYEMDEEEWRRWRREGWR